MFCKLFFIYLALEEPLPLLKTEQIRNEPVNPFFGQAGWAQQVWALKNTDTLIKPISLQLGGVWWAVIWLNFLWNLLMMLFPGSAGKRKSRLLMRIFLKYKRDIEAQNAFVTHGAKSVSKMNEPGNFKSKCCKNCGIAEILIPRTENYYLQAWVSAVFPTSCTVVLILYTSQILKMIFMHFHLCILLLPVFSELGWVLESSLFSHFNHDKRRFGMGKTQLFHLAMICGRGLGRAADRPWCPHSMMHSYRVLASPRSSYLKRILLVVT